MDYIMFMAKIERLNKEIHEKLSLNCIIKIKTVGIADRLYRTGGCKISRYIINLSGVLKWTIGTTPEPDEHGEYWVDFKSEDKKFNVQRECNSEIYTDETDIIGLCINDIEQFDWIL